MTRLGQKKIFKFSEFFIFSENSSAAQPAPAPLICKPVWIHTLQTSLQTIAASPCPDSPEK
ncbi:hypothetical protein STRDD11_00588 [Streptococcus sp. DD11]|nr:hypothetical protein STRDD11_00588 [Streptococcus sp. DD11]